MVFVKCWMLISKLKVMLTNISLILQACCWWHSCLIWPQHSSGFFLYLFLCKCLGNCVRCFSLTFRCWSTAWAQRLRAGHFGREAVNETLSSRLLCSAIYCCLLWRRKVKLWTSVKDTLELVVDVQSQKLVGVRSQSPALSVNTHYLSA